MQGRWKVALRGLACACLAWVAMGCAANAGNGGGASAPVVEFLGADAANVVAAATRVEPYKLKAAMESPNAEGPDAVGGYYWQTRGADLWPAQAEELKDILLDSASYDFDVVKKCVFAPDFAFRFVAYDRSTVLLVSMQCGVWAVAGPDEPATANFDPAADAIRAIVETVFKLK